MRGSTRPTTPLRTEIDSELSWVQGDPSQLRQVLVNLTSNALDALGGRRGGVRLSLQNERSNEPSLGGAYFSGGLGSGEDAVVEVADDGDGMPPSTLQRILEPFYTTKSDGLGLGLVAVLGSFAGTKGAIFVESSPGRGASFRVHLEAVAAPPASGGESEALERGGGGTVLFADADESKRALAERAFRQFGFRRRMASNVEETLEILRGARRTWTSWCSTAPHWNPTHPNGSTGSGGGGLKPRSSSPAGARKRKLTSGSKPHRRTGCCIGRIARRN